ncbi:AbgT family transporter [Aeromonas sp.]|uniref:AbgT family transporter n=1 Tax=Aeromonas sp. TaxID=647 RepID=UPI00258AB254|nr:AbgT family transporter [Aeromonas sp.]
MSHAAVNDRPASPPKGWLNRFLNGVEKAGNKLPDPAMLFLYALLIVWVGSWVLSQFQFDLVNPRTGEAVVVNNLLTGAGLAEFLSTMVTTFTGFAPLAAIVLLALALSPADSPLRAADGSLTTFAAPVMKSIVPLIFLLFILPGIVYGFVAGSFKSGKDVIDAMSATMNQMGSYMVMAFFCALFIKAFGDSNLGTLLALSGAEVLHALALPGEVTIVGMILLTASVNLVVGSASAKWALISPILVPMLMAVGISPELTQAAYRVGDSASNIITPLMVFFPLVVVYCQQYVKSTGIGTLVSMMLPYSLAFLVSWTIFLLLYRALGFPLGLQAPYVYPAP